MGVTFITVPLTLHYLKTERFGLWMTISAVLAMANFADFGVGNGVLNAVSTAFGKDDVEGIRRAISSGIVVLTCIGLALASVFLASYRFVEWGDLFHVTSPIARQEAGPAMAVFFLSFVCNLPLDVVQRVQLGLQEGYQTNFWQILSSLAALTGVLVAINLHLGLPALVMAFAGAPVLGTASNAIHFFLIKRPDLLPKRQFVSRSMITQITRLGGLFFVLQVGGTISYSADNFVIARALGASDVAAYSIPQRLFAFVMIPVTMLLVPFWPAYGEAYSRGDIKWVRRTLITTLAYTFAGTSLACGLILFGSRPILRLWVGTQINPPFFLMLGMAIWTILNCCSNTLGVFLNGAGVVRFQIFTTGAFSLSCLVLKILFTHYYGIVGVPWASTLAFVVLSMPVYLWYVPKLLNRMTHNAKVSAAAQIENGGSDG